MQTTTASVQRAASPSKKKKSYELVKEKDIESIYLEVKGREYSDFIYLREVINLPYLDNFK